MDIKFSSTVLLVDKIDLSRNFYESILGQQVELDHGECIVFSTGFSIWERTYAEQLIFGEVTMPGHQGHGMELYFETEQLEEVYCQLKAAEVKLVHEIQEQPWGQRVLRVFDPDQRVIEIAESMDIVIKRYLEQGMNPEQIAARTSMPIEIVRTVLM